MSNLSFPRPEIIATLKTEIKNCRIKFDILSARRTINGSWEDNIWRYKGKNINFYSLTHSKHSSTSRYTASESAISGHCGDLLKAFVTTQVWNDRSTELTSSYLISAKFLYNTLGPDISKWHLATKADFDMTFKIIQSAYASKASIYHRGNSLNFFIRYLCSIRQVLNDRVVYFLNNRSPWRHGVENPDRAREEEKLLSINSRGAKYPDGLEAAFGAVKAKLLQHPNLEKKPDSDSLLIQIQTFALSMGLRFKEISTLPYDAYLPKESFGTPRLRVWTEKGDVPVARPIPDIWNDLVRESTEYLQYSCASARERALEIEKNGFDFIVKLAESKGKLSPELQEMIVESDITVDISDLCSTVIVKALGLSEKQFQKGGKYSAHLVTLRSPRMIKISAHINTLVTHIETNEILHSIKNYISQKTRSVSPKKIGMEAGLPAGSCLNTTHVKNVLSEIAGQLESLRQGIQKNRVFLEAERRGVIEALRGLQPGLQSYESSGTKSLINFRTLINQLASDYANLLQQHFDENCRVDDILNSTYSYTLSSPSFECKLPLSQHMIVLWSEQLNSNTPTPGVLPRPLLQSDLYNWISSKGGKKNIFSRLNITDQQGEIYSFSMHQIRHWLTTSLLRSGPSEMLVNLWMGRKSEHIRNYDHRTPKERAEFLRSRKIYQSINPPPDWLGRKVQSMRMGNFSEKEISEYIDSKLSIIHFTPWGYCSRELTIMPCTKGLMCLKGFGKSTGCENFHIVITDLVARKKIEDTFNNYKASLLALEPRLKDLKEDFLRQLDENSTLDVHFRHIIDVMKGCESALEAYDSNLHNPKSTIIKVFQL